MSLLRPGVIEQHKTQTQSPSIPTLKLPPLFMLGQMAQNHNEQIWRTLMCIRSFVLEGVRHLGTGAHNAIRIILPPFHHTLTTETGQMTQIFLANGHSINTLWHLKYLRSFIYMGVRHLGSVHHRKLSPPLNSIPTPKRAVNLLREPIWLSRRPKRFFKCKRLQL